MIFDFICLVNMTISIQYTEIHVCYMFSVMWDQLDPWSCNVGSVSNTPHRLEMWVRFKERAPLLLYVGSSQNAQSIAMPCGFLKGRLDPLLEDLYQM